MLTRLAAANHHKPPPKRRKYAGFGTMGIPAIRESIVLHRQGLATLNFLRLSLILAVVCSGLRWFVIACFPLFSLPIIPNSGGDLWWFARICGRLRWFVVVCLIVIPVRNTLVRGHSSVTYLGNAFPQEIGPPVLPTPSYR